jgi:hypothetical protein
MSSVDSWLVVIADAAKMEEKHASLTGIAGEVECTPDAAEGRRYHLAGRHHPRRW